jgi:hypothetical protein
VTIPTIDLLPLVLAIAAGSNALFTALIVGGLVTFTPHVELTPALAPFAGIGSVALVAILLAFELVLSKHPRTSRAAMGVHIPIAAAAAALFAVGLQRPGHEPSALVGSAAAAIAAGVAWVRYRGAMTARRPMAGLGHIVVSIAADVCAGVVTAATFAIAR